MLNIFFLFSFGHCIVCLLISDLWLSFRFFQTFLVSVSYLGCFYVHSKVRGYCWYCYHYCSNQELRGVPLTDLTSLHVCACPKPGPGFTTSYVMVFLVFSVIRLDVIVHFVDIVGIVNHHCLNYLFIKSFPFKF